VLKDFIALGIDQTGAIDSKGRPKKLAVSFYCSRRKIVVLEKLDSLTLTSLKKIIEKNDISFLKRKVFIAVDSVLGLPKSCEISLNQHQLFALAKSFTYEGRSYGAKTAFQFFSRFISSEGGQISRRKCEVLANANSVFSLTPYQKNIGCGTFRVWKDLALEPDWFRLASETESVVPQSERAVIFEGYPSLSWKKVIGTSSRDLAKLQEICSSQKLSRKHFPYVELAQKIPIPQNLDEADAMVLLFHLCQIVKDKPLFEKEIQKHRTKESWILGL
jgi:hypothetical protein